MKIKTRTLVQFAFLLAIEILFCFTPLGSIPIGPIVATLAMIPVMVTAIMLGTKYGAIMGGFVGLFRFLLYTFAPPNPMTAFLFTPFYSLGEFQGNAGSLVIVFLPRIATGLVAGLLYQRFLKIAVAKNKSRYGVMLLTSVLSSLFHTISFMLLVWLFFGNQYASIQGKSMLAIIGTTIATNGALEAIICGIAVPAICNPLQKIMHR